MFLTMNNMLQYIVHNHTVCTILSLYTVDLLKSDNIMHTIAQHFHFSRARHRSPRRWATFIYGMMDIVQGRAATLVIGTTTPFIEGGRTTRG